MESLPASSSPCAMHAYHRPRPILTERHHIVPVSWVGGPGESGETALVCATGHQNIHANIDALVRGTATPSKRGPELGLAHEAMTRAKAMGATPAPTL